MVKHLQSCIRSYLSVPEFHQPIKKVSVFVEIGQNGINSLKSAQLSNVIYVHPP